MPAKTCPQCLSEYDLSQQFCPADGAPLRLQNEPWNFVGRVFGGRYRLIRRLGGGGMGDVYLAEHVRLKNLVAVKVMRPAMTDDPDAVARFNREAQNASVISHPNVARVYDYGESDELVFIAMEYVDGEPLSAIIARGPMEPVRAARIIHQIGDALFAAHRLGIIHRDLKPENVMVGNATDDRDIVKLVDFGISKVPESVDQKITVSGAILGTPAFMSPEQACGELLDPRSDLYSFGILTFNMLTGKLPFAGKTAQDQIVSRLTAAAASLAETDPKLPRLPMLEGVLARILARDPIDRYQTSLDYVDAFEQALSEWIVQHGDQPMSVSAILGRRPTRRTGAINEAETPARGSGVPAGRLSPTQPIGAVADARGSRTARWSARRFAMVGAGSALLLLGLAAYKLSTGPGSDPKPDTTPAFPGDPNKPDNANAKSKKERAITASPPSVDASARSTAPKQSTRTADTTTRANVPAETRPAAPVSHLPAGDSTKSPATQTTAPAPSPTTSPASSSTNPQVTPPVFKVVDTPFVNKARNFMISARALANDPPNEAALRDAIRRGSELLHQSPTAADSVAILVYRSPLLELNADHSNACAGLRQARLIAKKDMPFASQIDPLLDRLNCG